MTIEQNRNQTTMPHDPVIQAQRHGWQLVEKTEVKGDGIQAPGFVTLVYTGGTQPYVVHFFNAQDGGFHSGHYCDDSDRAYEAYRDAIRRWTRHHT